MLPIWLHILASGSIVVGLVCSAAIVFDEVRHPQHMWIMNLVWPISALFTSAAGFWTYFTYGRLATHERAKPAIAREQELPSIRETHFSDDQKALAPRSRMLSWRHSCGMAFFLPAVAVWFGWRSLFCGCQGGCAFADTAWQLGMYAFMAFAQFYLFRHLLGLRLEVDSAVFWFTMQIAMIAGFVTSYPANWWLITVGVKEKM